MKNASSQVDSEAPEIDKKADPDADRVAAAFRRINDANRSIANEVASPVFSIPVVVQVVVGATRLPISKLLSLEIGAVIDLDQKVGEPVDIVVNDRVIARGELGVLEGENPSLYVTITELMTSALV